VSPTRFVLHDYFKTAAGVKQLSSLTQQHFFSTGQDGSPPSTNDTSTSTATLGPPAAAPSLNPTDIAAFREECRYAKDQLCSAGLQTRRYGAGWLLLVYGKRTTGGPCSACIGGYLALLMCYSAVENNRGPAHTDTQTAVPAHVAPAGSGGGLMGGPSCLPPTTLSGTSSWT
jgi:hypothetical protein